MKSLPSQTKVKASLVISNSNNNLTYYELSMTQYQTHIGFVTVRSVLYCVHEIIRPLFNKLYVKRRFILFYFKYY